LLALLTSTVQAQLVLQEILADPPSGFRGDANRDGLRDPSDDAFVEFVNTGASALDLSNYQLRDATTLRHVIPAGTVLAPLQALVVFGGGTPTGSFGGAVVQTASTGSLSLSNAGDAVILANASGTVLINYVYGPEANQNASITRQPEFVATTLNALHSAVIPSSGAPFSPGTGNDGFAYNAPSTTLVRFMDPVGITGEDSGSLSIRVKLIQPSAGNSTTVFITRSGGSASAADLGGFSSGSLFFAPGTSGVQTLVVPVANDAAVEDLESIQFTLTASGGSSAAAAEGASTWKLYDNDLTTALKWNEILADPAPLLAGDANGDGLRDAADDEFIELVNTGAGSLDLSNYQFGDGSQIRHRFPAGTVLAPQQAIVVFGGGEPAGLFGGALVQTSSEGDLGLTNGGDQLTLFTPLGNPLLSFVYDSLLGGQDQSMNRAPDLTGPDGGFVRHNLVPGSGPRIFSPGTRVNNTPFPTGLPTSLQFTKTNVTAVEGSGTINLEVGILFASLTNPSSVQIRLVQGNPARVGGFSLGTLNFPAGSIAPRSQSITLSNDALQQGNDTLLFALENASGGLSAAVGAADTFTLILYDNDLVSPLLLNEIHADPASDLTGDANADGFRDPIQDEFLEWVNTGTSTVNVSGWTLHDATALRHIFPAGSTVNPGQALVIFGGGSPAGSFGGARVQVASEGRLSLQNEGEEIRLEDPSGNTVLVQQYGVEGGSDQSINRSPDLTGPSQPFALHTTLFATKLYSPGTRVDGSAFGGPVTCSTTSPPTGLSSTLGTSAVTLNWNAIPASVACQLKVGPTTGGSRTFNAIGTERSSFNIAYSGLVAGTTYTWRVRCACVLPPGPGDATAFSASSLFTVPTAREAAPQPWSAGHASYLQGVIQLPIQGEWPESLQVLLVDASGRTLLQQELSGSNLLQLDAGALSAGLYHLILSDGTVRTAQTLSIQF